MMIRASAMQYSSTYSAPVSTNSIGSLNSIKLPPKFGFSRVPVHPGALSVAGYADYYDTDTLVYDWFIVDGFLYLVCPKLLNLKPLLLGANIDGYQLRHSDIQDNNRYDLIRLPGGISQEHRIEIPAIGFSGKCQPQNDQRFSGRNVLMTMQKNNRLNWIEDWVKFHVEHHGADAVLLFDNGSDLYPPDAVVRVIANVPGIRECLVVSVPHRYGPHRAPYRGLAKSRFLQPALWNIAKLKYLGGCRASLFIDIDEMVYTNNGRSIFDATVSKYWGYITFSGEWWDSAVDFSVVKHEDHFRESPAGKACPTKYCLTPKSPFWRFSLSVHKFENDLFKLYPSSSEFWYAHHRKITSNWKNRVA